MILEKHNAHGCIYLVLLQSNRAYCISMHPSTQPIYVYLHIYTLCSLHTRHHQEIDMNVGYAYGWAWLATATSLWVHKIFVLLLHGVLFDALDFIIFATNMTSPSGWEIHHVQTHPNTLVLVVSSSCTCASLVKFQSCPNITIVAT